MRRKHQPKIFGTAILAATLAIGACGTTDSTESASSTGDVSVAASGEAPEEASTGNATFVSDTTSAVDITVATTDNQESHFDSDDLEYDESDIGNLDEQGDGIDANGHIVMTGGVVSVSGATDTRNSAVDYSGGTFVMTGGTFIGTNVDGRNSEGIGIGSSQASMYVTTGSTLSAGTVVQIQNADGENLVTFEPANAYSVIAFSSPDLVDGESYDVYVSGTLAGTVTASVQA